jgi:hypothetical protein
MNHLLRHAAAAAAALLALAPVQARTTTSCYHFDGQAAGASWPVDPAQAVPISIGEVRIRPLVLDGVEVAPAQRFFRVAPAGQHIAGGSAPEMQGKNVAVQVVPRPGATSVSLKLSHQPGPEMGRAAMVEVNGARHDWRGSFASLNERALGSGRAAANFEVDVTPVGDSLWHSGWLRVSSVQGIESFSIGAAELRLDDVCIER